MYDNEDHAFSLGDQYTPTREGVQSDQGRVTHQPGERSRLTGTL